MKAIKLLFLLQGFLLLLYGCSSKSDQRQTDTIVVLRNVFSSRPFFEMLPKQFDTIYLLKNKFYNLSWPKKINQVHLKYIQDSKEAEVSNFLNPPPDPRMRYMITNLIIKNDSAMAVLHNFNFQSGITYKMHKNDGIWEVDSTNVVLR